MSIKNTDHHTDIAIIGAGPVGLFAIFECGMMKLKCHVIDSLEMIGGQCSALYPEKPIYDIPAHPAILAQELVDKLAEQAAPFSPTYHLNERVEAVQNMGTDGFILTLTSGITIQAKAILIAAGVGAFGPNKPPIDNLESFENKSVFYMVKRKSDFAGKTIMIAGGGDSALDWAISLSEIAKKVKLVHRRDKFRAAPESVDKLHSLVNQGKIDLLVPYQLEGLKGENGQLSQVVLNKIGGGNEAIDAEILLAFYGLSMNLGPIADWGLDLDKKHIKITPDTCATNVPGIYAIGDISHYEGKLKLILCGFSEAAMAAHAIFKYLHPNELVHFEYSTTKGIPG